MNHCPENTPSIHFNFEDTSKVPLPPPRKNKWATSSICRTPIANLPSRCSQPSNPAQFATKIYPSKMQLSANSKPNSFLKSLIKISWSSTTMIPRSHRKNPQNLLKKFSKGLKTAKKAHKQTATRTSPFQKPYLLTKIRALPDFLLNPKSE